MERNLLGDSEALDRVPTGRGQAITGCSTAGNEVKIVKSSPEDRRAVRRKLGMK